MANCGSCSVREVGDVSMGMWGVVGSVKRSGRRWAWHVHSIDTKHNGGNGYTLDGRSKSKDEALSIVHAIGNITSVALKELR